MSKLVAVQSHAIPERAPMRIVPGQRVEVRDRDGDWPAFVFVLAGDSAGWVPERYLDTSSGVAVAIASYDTTELATTAGEPLTLITRDDPSGWVWVRNAGGQEGWVPLNTVDPVPAD